MSYRKLKIIYLYSLNYVFKKRAVLLIAGCSFFNSTLAQTTSTATADALLLKADSLYYIQENLISSLAYYKNALSKYEEKKIYNKQIVCLLSSALINRKFDYSQALKDSYKALELINRHKLSTPFFLENIYGTFAYVHYNLQINSDSSTYYLKKFDTYIDSIANPKPENYSDLVRNYYGTDLCYRKVRIYIGLLSLFYRRGDQQLYAKILQKIEKQKKCIASPLNAWQKIILNVGLATPTSNYAYIIEQTNQALNQLHSIDYLKNFETYKLHNLLSQTYHKLGMFKEAIHHARQSLYHYEKWIPKNSPSLSKQYNRIGELLRQEGEYEKALSYYKQAYSLLLKYKGPVNFSTGSLCNNIGETYFALKKYQDALDWHKKALDIRLKIPNHPYRTNSYDNLGITYLQLNDMAKAKSFIRKGLELREKFPQTAQYERYYIKSYSHLGDWYQRNSDYKKALDYYQKALDANISGTRDEKLAQYFILNKMGQTHIAARNPQKALVTFSKAEKLNHKSEGNSKSQDIANIYEPIAAIQSLLGQAEALKILNNDSQTNLTTALQAYEKAIKLLESIRQKISTQNDKLFITGQNTTVYQNAMDLAHKLYSLTGDKMYQHKMFFISESNKSGALLDALNKQILYGKGILPDSILELETRLNSLYTYYQQQQKNAVGEAKNEWKQKVFETQLQRDAFIQKLESEYPNYYTQNYQNHVLTIENIQAKLHNKSAFLEFFSTDLAIYAFLITPNNFQVKRISAIDNHLIQELRNNIISQSIEGFFPPSFQLYKQLIAPLELSNVDKLIIVPDKEIWFINFELLVKSIPEIKDFRTADYLLRQMAISYAYSARHLFVKRKKPKNNDILAIAPSYHSLNQDKTSLSKLGKFRGEVGELIYNQQEAQLIIKEFQGESLLGNQATEKGFKNNIKSYAIIHLAMHALIDNDTPANSRLVFTHLKDSLEDNFLHIYELYNMRIDAQLAVLSACNTGYGKLQNGEGFMSLGRAFAYAGCPSVVLSHWKVDDLATSKLMALFYKQMSNGLSKSEALRQAKLKYLEDCSPTEGLPYLWGVL